MQIPTCSNIRIRSTQDAHKIFYGVKQGLLHMVLRRLDTDERSALGTGCVYAWEERGPHSELTGLGIERFTEGRRWSPSRVRDEFLFYYEKFVPPPESQQPGSSSTRLPPRDWDPLIKQTYSVWVETTRGRRKWHLTAYFTQATVDRLGTVDDIPALRDLVVPDGLFKSTRTSKSRSKTDEQAKPTHNSRSTPTVTRSYAPFPSPALYPAANLNQSSPVEQEPHTPCSPYPENLPYPLYYQSPTQPTNVSTNSATMTQYPRTQVQGSYQYPTPLATPQSNYSLEASLKDERYSKTTEESSYTKYGTVHHNLPILSSSQARLPQQVHPVPSYGRGATNGITTHGTNAHHLHSASRDYENISYPASTASNSLTGNIANPNYMLGLSDTEMPGSTYTPGHPAPHLRSQQYAETPSQEKNPYLPPLHSVEAIQASVYALASPGEILIPIEDRKSTVGPNRDLAPLQSLARPYPYRREPLDERTLRLLRPRD